MLISRMFCKLTNFFCYFILSLANIACVQEYEQAVDSENKQVELPVNLIEVREEATKWIETNKYQAAIMHLRMDNDKFVEVASGGSHVSHLRRYIDDRSFDLFRRNENIESVIAILSQYRHEADRGGVRVQFYPVISGNVSLAAGDDKLIINAVMFMDLMQLTPQTYNK